MTAVVDVLVRAGARVPDLVQAAATGDLRGFRPEQAEPTDRLLALLAAVHHQRVAVIDALIAAGAPVDRADPIWGRHPLRLAAQEGRPASVRRLLELGADPRVRDDQGRTPLDLCRAGRLQQADPTGHDQVEALLTA
jgi:ankyrin repeat protein